MVSLCRRFYKLALHNAFVSCRSLHYVQGQSPKRRCREYFYYIDHQGMLFLDDSKIKNFTSCLKEKDFLVFFFNRLRVNTTDRYEEFPYISLCGREKNYVRCDDKPIVFTHILKSNEKNTQDKLCYGNAGNAMIMNFDPTKICMLPNTGRVYYPCSPQYGGIGLVRSSLAIELSEWFEFEDGQNNPPTHFYWNGERMTLTNELIALMDKSPQEVQELLEV